MPPCRHAVAARYHMLTPCFFLIICAAAAVMRAYAYAARRELHEARDAARAQKRAFDDTGMLLPPFQLISSPPPLDAFIAAAMPVVYHMLIR